MSNAPNAPAAPAKAEVLGVQVYSPTCAELLLSDAPSPLAAQLAEAVDLLRGMEGRLPLSHPGRARLDAFFAAINAGRARAKETR